jgi:hypothetical protein
VINFFKNLAPQQPTAASQQQQPAPASSSKQIKVSSKADHYHHTFHKERLAEET